MSDWNSRLREYELQMDPTFYDSKSNGEKMKFAEKFSQLKDRKTPTVTNHLMLSERAFKKFQEQKELDEKAEMIRKALIDDEYEDKMAIQLQVPRIDPKPDYSQRLLNRVEQFFTYRAPVHTNQGYTNHKMWSRRSIVLEEYFRNHIKNRRLNKLDCIHVLNTLNDQYKIEMVDTLWTDYDSNPNFDQIFRVSSFHETKLIKETITRGEFDALSLTLINDFLSLQKKIRQHQGRVPIFLKENTQNLNESDYRVESTLIATTRDGFLHVRPLCTAADFSLAVSELNDPAVFSEGVISVPHILPPNTERCVEGYYRFCYQAKAKCSFEFLKVKNIPSERKELRSYVHALLSFSDYFFDTLTLSETQLPPELVEFCNKTILSLNLLFHPINEIILSLGLDIEVCEVFADYRNLTRRIIPPHLVPPKHRVQREYKYRVIGFHGLKVQSCVSAERRKAVCGLDGLSQVLPVMPSSPNNYILLLNQAFLRDFHKYFHQEWDYLRRGKPLTTSLDALPSSLIAAQELAGRLFRKLAALKKAKEFTSSDEEAEEENQSLPVEIEEPAVIQELPQVQPLPIQEPPPVKTQRQPSLTYKSIEETLLSSAQLLANYRLEELRREQMNAYSTGFNATASPTPPEPLRKPSNSFRGSFISKNKERKTVTIPSTSLRARQQTRIEKKESDNPSFTEQLETAREALIADFQRQRQQSKTDQATFSLVNNNKQFLSNRRKKEKAVPEKLSPSKPVVEFPLSPPLPLLRNPSPEKLQVLARPDASFNQVAYDFATRLDLSHLLRGDDHLSEKLRDLQSRPRLQPTTTENEEEEEDHFEKEEKDPAAVASPWKPESEKSSWEAMVGRLRASRGRRLQRQAYEERRVDEIETLLSTLLLRLEFLQQTHQSDLELKKSPKDRKSSSPPRSASPTSNKKEKKQTKKKKSDKLYRQLQSYLLKLRGLQRQRYIKRRRKQERLTKSQLLELLWYYQSLPQHQKKPSSKGQYDSDSDDEFGKTEAEREQEETDNLLNRFIPSAEDDSEDEEDHQEEIELPAPKGRDYRRQGVTEETMRQSFIKANMILSPDNESQASRRKSTLRMSTILIDGKDFFSEELWKSRFPNRSSSELDPLSNAILTATTAATTASLDPNLKTSKDEAGGEDKWEHMTDTLESLVEGSLFSVDGGGSRLVEPSLSPIRESVEHHEEARRVEFAIEEKNDEFPEKDSFGEDREEVAVERAINSLSELLFPEEGESEEEELAEPAIGPEVTRESSLANSPFKESTVAGDNDMVWIDRDLLSFLQQLTTELLPHSHHNHQNHPPHSPASRPATTTARRGIDSLPVFDPLMTPRSPFSPHYPTINNNTSHELGLHRNVAENVKRLFTPKPPPINSRQNTPAAYYRKVNRPATTPTKTPPVMTSPHPPPQSSSNNNSSSQRKKAMGPEPGVRLGLLGKSLFPEKPAV